MILKEVFVAGGIPKTTYVSRNRLNLEKKLRGALAEGHQIIALTGATKSGKTVLCRRVLESRKTLWVDAGQVSSTEEFWKLAAQKLDIPGEYSISESNDTKFGFRYVVSAEGGNSEVASEKYFSDPKIAALTACKENNICLVIDDFHYLDDKIQKNVIRNLKSEIFDGLDVIVIAVPHRAFDTIRNEKEMEGRFVHIEIPPWELDELKEISKKGFPALKVIVPDDLQDEFSREAFHSPILMQRFCLKVCTEYEIFETLKIEREISPSDRVRKEIYNSVAENYGFPTFKVLSEGPQSRTDRLPRRLKQSTEKVDIYHALLRAIARTGPKSALPYDEIREAMRQTVVDSDMPQKHQITNSLNYMSREAKAKVQGEPPLEWRDEVLYITDPSLSFYLRWAFSEK